MEPLNLGPGTKGSVSYIIPAYNAGEHILEALESCRQQTYRPIEVVVVNDGSHDTTREVVERFADRASSSEFSVICINQANAGVAAARNTGMRHCSGEILGNLDADDLLPSYRTALLCRGIGEYDADVAFGATEWFRSPAEVFSYMTRELRVEDISFSKVALEPALRFVPSVGQYLITRDFAQRVGQFSESLSMLEEGEYVFRLRCAQPNMYRCKEKVYLYRKSVGSITSYVTPDKIKERLTAHKLMSATMRTHGIVDTDSVKRIPKLFFNDGLNALRNDIPATAEEGFSLSARHGRGLKSAVATVMSMTCRRKSVAMGLGCLLRTRDRLWIPLRDYFKGNKVRR